MPNKTDKQEKTYLLVPLQLLRYMKIQRDTDGQTDKEYEPLLFVLRRPKQPKPVGDRIIGDFANANTPLNGQIEKSYLLVQLPLF